MVTFRSFEIYGVLWTLPSFDWFCLKVYIGRNALNFFSERNRKLKLSKRLETKLLREKLIMSSWTDIKYFSLKKILCCWDIVCWVDCQRRHILFSEIFSSEWPHWKHTVCRYVDSIYFFLSLERYRLVEVFDKEGKRTSVCKSQHKHCRQVLILKFSSNYLSS